MSGTSKTINLGGQVLIETNQFKGKASTSTNPGIPVEPEYWLANGPGTYTYFGNQSIISNVGFLIWDGSLWSKYEFEVDVVRIEEILADLNTLNTHNKTQGLTEAERIEYTRVRLKEYGCTDYNFNAPLSTAGDWWKKGWLTAAHIRSAKVIDKVGIFIAGDVQNPDTVPFSGNLLVKIWKNGVLVTEKTVDNTALNLKKPYTTIRNAEMLIDLDNTLNLAVDDILIVGYQHSGAEKLALFYFATEASTTEDLGILSCDSSNTAGWLAGLTAPTAPSATTFYIPFRAYEVRYENKKISDNETAITLKAKSSDVIKMISALMKNGVETYTEENRIIVPSTNVWVASDAFECKYFGVFLKGISKKIFDQVGIYLVRDFFNDHQFTDGITVKIFYDGLLVKSHVIAFTELAPYNSLTSSSPKASFEYKIPLDFPVELDIDKILFVGYECNAATDRISMLFQMNETPSDTAEWTRNYSIGGNTANTIINLEEQPSTPGSSAFFMPISVYYRRFAPAESKEDLDLLLPKKIYTVFNDQLGTGDNDLLGVRMHSIPVFIDSLIEGISEELDVDFDASGKEKIQVYAPEMTTDILSENKSFDFGNSAKYNDGSVTFIQKSVKESIGKDFTPKIMCIGDSVTSGYLAGVGVPSGMPSQYWAVIKEQFEQAKIDSGDDAGHHKCILVGHYSSCPWTMVYGGQTRSLKPFAEGYGGWSTPSHLYWSRNWAVRTQGLWDMLGLGDGTGTDYVNSAPQNLLMFTTPEGKNAPIDTTIFRTWLNTELTGAATNYAEAVALLDAKEADPENPFYDKTTALAVDVAFSISAYLARYKTLANDGTTRLLVGSTAGTKVTDADAYDVCLPTHFVLSHSHNDGDVAWFATNLRKWTDAIKAEYTAQSWGDVFIGISVIRFTGTYYPSRYPMFDKNSISLWNHVGAGYNNYRKVIDEFWVSDANEDSEKIYILPSLNVQPPAWSTPFRKIQSPEFDLLANEEFQFRVIDGAGPTWHPNGFAHRAWGLEMYAWIRYTLSLM
ncbi:MAG: hypothetical protein NTU51_05860 [Bacteroidetes bacterium]|nr:hypothetical protein [Bacteroidota bacterium]